MEQKQIQIMKQVPIDQLHKAGKNILARFTIEQPESEELADLVNSIRKNGVIEPIIVRETKSNNYEVIAGNRRLRAAKIAKITQVPIIVMNVNDSKARMIAFIENVIRKDSPPIEKAKGIAAMYEDIGIPKEIAIRKLHRLKNESVKSDPFASRKGFHTEITPEFKERYNEIPLGYDTQYALLQLVTQLSEETQEKIQEAKLSFKQAQFLTHTKLRAMPKIQNYLVDKIKGKTKAESKNIVAQTVIDLDNHDMWQDKDGIHFGSSHTENITVKPEIANTFDVKVPELREVIMETIKQLLDRPIAKGEISYSDANLKSKFEELKNNLSTVAKRERNYLAMEAGVLAQICKIIVDAAK